MDNNSPNLTHRLHKLDDDLFFSAAAAALGLAGVAAYVLVYRAALKLWLAWIAPLAFLIAAGVLIVLYWRRKCLLASFSPVKPTADAPSAQVNPLGLRVLLGAAALGYLALYLLVAGVCLRFVYNGNHFAGLVFGVIYAGLSALVAFCAYSVRHPAQAQVDWRAQALPGGLHLARIGAFWLGFLLPMVSMGLQPAQLSRVNLLFQRDQAWKLVSDVPDAAVIGLGVVYFIILEVLISQAGAAWLRLRQGEWVAGGKWNIALRWLIGAVMAYLVGGEPLLVIAIALILHTELSISPIERQLRRVVPSVLLQALGSALIFLGGALAWLGERWSFTLVLALVPAVFFLALAYAAGQLSRHLNATQPPLGAVEAEPDALHLLFTQTRITRWQQIGLAAAGLAALLQLVLQVLAEKCNFYNSLLSPNYARCIPTGIDHMAYFELGAVNGALLAFDLIIVLLALGWLLARLLRPLAGLVSRLPQPARRYLGWGLIGLTVVLIAVAIVVDRPSWVLGAVLVRTVAAGVRG